MAAQVQRGNEAKEFRKEYLKRITDDLGVVEDAYVRHVKPQQEMNWRRRDEAEVAKALESLTTQKATLSRLEQDLDRAGPYLEGSLTEKARQKSLEYTRAWLALPAASRS